MQERKILFLEESPSFMITSIKDGLAQSGFDCSSCKLNVTEMSKLSSTPPIIFLYVSETTPQNFEGLSYLRDKCTDEDLQLYLMGYEDEMREVLNMMPSTIIGGTFKRPINASDIVSRLMTDSSEDSVLAKKKHILVVDDSATMLRAVKDWLEPKYRVSMVNSATNAISFLANTKPDLILLDYEMPICTGPMMLQMIRSEVKTESIPVMFLTSHGDRESVQQVMSLRPQGYLLKTMAPKQIVDSIDKFFSLQKLK